MNKRLQLILSLFFSGLALAVGAQDKPKAERPAFTIGDTWAYSYADKADANRTANYTSTVTAIEANQITFARQNNRGATLTNADLNEIKAANGRTETPHSFSYDWPLEVGKEWPREITWTNANGGFGRSTGKRKVIAYEKVTVAAGTFDAFLIEFTGYYNDDSHRTSGREVSGPETIRNWYAPAVKNIVKYQRTYRANGVTWEDSTIELQSYSIK